MELNQTNYDEGGFSLPLSAPGEPHAACAILLDTSGSMSPYIKDLENAIQKFIEDTNKNEITKRRVDVAVIEFNTEVNVIQEFTPIYLMKSVKLSAGGVTSMGKGIKSAIEIVSERTELYQRLGTPRFRPWIFMLTDGAPTDDITEAREMIRNEEKHKSGNSRLRFFALGVGELYDKEVLLSLTERVLDLNGYDFNKAFNWLSDSLVLLSSTGDPNNEARLPLLPENVRIVKREEPPTTW